MSEIVGIDPGSARIGVAVADLELRMALPLATVDAKQGFTAAVAAIALLLQERKISEMIVGLPLHASGQESESSRQARILGGMLEEKLECPVRYWDERMTTLLAQEALTDAGISGRRQREYIDSSAAAIILQSYLDQNARTPQS